MRVSYNIDYWVNFLLLDLFPSDYVILHRTGLIIMCAIYFTFIENNFTSKFYINMKLLIELALYWYDFTLKLKLRYKEIEFQFFYLFIVFLMI